MLGFNFSSVIESLIVCGGRHLQKGHSDDDEV